MCLGVPGKLMSISENNAAVVDVNGNQVEISTALTPDAEIGQWVLVHAGFAMQVMDESEAEESLALMLELQKIRESLLYEQ